MFVSDTPRLILEWVFSCDFFHFVQFPGTPRFRHSAYFCVYLVVASFIVYVWVLLYCIIYDLFFKSGYNLYIFSVSSR